MEHKRDLLDFRRWTFLIVLLSVRDPD